MADHFNNYGIPHHPERFQEVTNSSWPEPAVAERLRDVEPIAVRVRIVWNHDGEAWLDGSACRWSGRHVFVRFTDERSRVGFAWVDAADVERREIHGASDADTVTS
jgi:hypothetical protein